MTLRHQSRGSQRSPERTSQMRLLAAVGAILLFALPLKTLNAQDIWKGATGNWSQGSNWSTGQPPTNAQDALIDNGNSAVSAVTADSASICHNLFLDADDTLTVGPGYLDIYGTTVTNNSTITVTSGNGFQIVSPSVTLTGNGVVNLAGPSINGFGGGVFTNANNTIQGFGAVGLGEIGIVNQGTINATGPMAVQPNSSGATNTGTLEASNGGVMSLYANFNNTGGTIQALNGGTVSSHAMITGGILTTAGTGAISVAGGVTGYLTNLTNNGLYNVLTAGTTVLTGTITNNGTLQMSSTGSGTDLLMNGNVTLNGTGSVTMSNSNNYISVGGANAALINNSTVQGGGNIVVALTNNHLINGNAPPPGMSIAPGAAGTTNSGIIQASNGGFLNLSNTTQNSNGTVQALSGSTLQVQGTISGGKVTTSGTGVVQSMNGTLDGTSHTVTNSGKFLLAGSGTIQGTVNNTGSIVFGGNVALFINGAATLTGSGRVLFGNNANATFYGEGSTPVLTNYNSISGAGTVSRFMGLLNHGSITATYATPLIIFPDSSGFTNYGRLTVNSGSVLQVQGVFTNYAAGTLNGGTYFIAGTWQLGNGPVTTNAANLTLSGVGAQITDLSNNPTTQLLALNASNGILTVQGGKSLVTSGNLTNNGITLIGISSGLTAHGAYTQAAGKTTVDGTLQASSGINLKAGTLFGRGTMVGHVVSNAAVTPADSPTAAGKLGISGSYAQQSLGALNIRIAGNTAGLTYDQLAVAGAVSLSGTLNISRLSTYTPPLNTTFQILTAQGLTGKFSTVNGTSINLTEHFAVSYSSTGVTLTVVPGP